MKAAVFRSDIPSSISDAPQDAELLLSTHLTVVVRARCAHGELGLVVARQHCVGDRPHLRALMEAARRCATRGRTTGVEACIGGEWVTLLEEDAGEDGVGEGIDTIATLKGTSTMNASKTHASKTPVASRLGAAAAACAGLLAFTGAGQALAGTPQENYRQERANCMNGNTTQDRATCLREAGAALQESRRHGLTTPSREVMAQNAVQRCQRQPKEDRADCERLALGQGTQEGSVGEGAIVREIATLQAQPTGAGQRGN